jgi:hypothetical protein
MLNLENGTTAKIQYISYHPVLVIASGIQPLDRSRADSDKSEAIDNRTMIAGRFRFGNQDSIHAAGGINSFDLDNLKLEVKQAIYKKLKEENSNIPLIDSGIINDSDHIIFVTGFDKNHFPSWTALDLLTVSQFHRYVDRGLISIEKTAIPSPGTAI